MAIIVVVIFCLKKNLKKQTKHLFSAADSKENHAAHGQTPTEVRKASQNVPDFTKKIQRINLCVKIQKHMTSL